MPDFMQNETLPVVESPRLTTLISPLQNADADALNAFWEQASQEGTPLIEMIAGTNDCIVTFLWRAQEELQQVLLIIDTMTDQYRRHDLTPCFMKHVAGTDIWHLSYQLQNDLRATYHFYTVGVQQPTLTTGEKNRDEWLAIITNTSHDPLNTKIFPARRGKDDLSVLELPQAPPHEWWQQRDNTPQGQLSQHRVTSAILKNERDIWVYQPAHYTPSHAPYPVLVLLDGEVWANFMSLQTTLDNLIEAGEIPPMIAVAVDAIDNATRGNELPCNPQFIDFLTDELFPWLKQSWNVTDDPAQTIITGQSYGGLTSAYAGFYAPQRFGNLFSQSGSFWWKEDDVYHEDSEWLVRQFGLKEVLPLRFYVSVGWQEWMLLACNRHLRDMLVAKGYPLTYSEHNGGHDYVCWRGGLADGLITLTRSWQTEDEHDSPPTLNPIQVTRHSTIPPQLPKPHAPEIVTSPRIEAFKAALAQGDPNAIPSFWDEVARHGTPLVEPLENDPEHRVVTFLWRGDDLEQVVILANKFTDVSVFEASIMEHIPHTDIWFRSYRIRSDWRASYKLAPFSVSQEPPVLGAYVARLVERAVAVGAPAPRSLLERWWHAVETAIPDPFNPKRVQDFSLVELPDAPAQHGLIPAQRDAKGQLTQHELHSPTLGNTRRVHMYTPVGYSSENPPHTVLVLLDGQVWIEDERIVTILDDLIEQGKIPPLVALLPDALDFDTRVREMAGHLPFIHFLKDELMTWASAHWNITDDPAHTIMGGLSLGGLTSALAGLVAPERFGNVLSQSGSFWWANGSRFDVDSEWLTAQFARLPPQPVRFYIEVGLQEWVLISPTRHLHSILKAKGYEVTYREFNGGHDKACFRGSLADGLIALTQSD